MVFYVGGRRRNTCNKMTLYFMISYIHLFALFQNGFVECVKDQCPDEQGCYMLQDVFVDTKGCCRRCKGKHSVSQLRHYLCALSQ